MSSLGHAAIFTGADDRTAARAHSERLLNAVLFVTVLLSAVAFIEPSPHDALMILLLLVCIGARVRLDRKLVPLVLLLTIWLVGGCFSLIPVSGQEQNIQYTATSFYLAFAGVMFACLFCDGSLLRLEIVRRAYLIAALIATAAGYIGFFHLLPHSDIFLDHDRVSATFKDPNVYGPFLIFPLLTLLTALMVRGVRFSWLILGIFLLGGLLLSFSRGAWGHFVISAAVTILLLFLTAPDARMRGRILLFTVGALILIVLLFIALMALPSVHDLFLERAKAIQPYDVGPGGRFWEQKLALSVILEHANGMGPFEFSRVYGTQQHDVYMQGFLVYGWLGGAAYLTFVLVTLTIGLRAALMRTPWQNYLIVAYAGFVGEAFEGLIVDTDHWRHFFLLLGMVWGLTAASINFRRQQIWAAGFDDNPALSASPFRDRRYGISDQPDAHRERMS